MTKTYKQKLIKKLQSYKMFDTDFIDNQINIINQSNCDDLRYKSILDGKPNNNNLYKTLLELYRIYKISIQKQILIESLKKHVTKYVTYYSDCNDIIFNHSAVYSTPKSDNLETSLTYLVNKVPNNHLKAILKNK